MAAGIATRRCSGTRLHRHALMSPPDTMVFATTYPLDDEHQSISTHVLGRFVRRF